MRAVSANWRGVNRGTPCPICGKGDWCSRSSNGEWIACRRLDTGEGIHRVDKAGADYWLYRIHGNPDDDHTKHQISLACARTAASPDTLHQVYEALLGMLPLEQYHRQNLHQRGLSDTEIARRQYRTLPTRGRAEFARRLVDGFGAKRCAQIQGLYIRAEDGRRWWSLAGASGLLIPVRNIKGRVIGLIVRSDDPDADPRYSAVSAKARGGPGPGAHIHVPLFEKAITHSVRLTEGAVKADVATVRNGTLTLGLPGVSVWGRALPVLGKLHIRSVILAFDADARHNWTVARALQRSAAAIRATGVEVVLEYWAEDDGEGIDDLLTAGKTPERLSGLAAIEAIRAIVRAAYTSDPLL